MATERSRSNFNSTIDGNITTNGTGLITGAIANSDFKDVAQSAAWLSDFNPITAAGTDTYTCSMGLTLTDYANGRFFLVKFTNANTGAATLNADGLGAKSIKKNGATALAAGDIGAGTVKLLCYDGTNFQIVTGQTDAAGDVAGPASSTNYAVVRFDGTTGKLVKSTAITLISDIGDYTSSTADANNRKITVGRSNYRFQHVTLDTGTSPITGRNAEVVAAGDINDGDSVTIAVYWTVKSSSDNTGAGGVYTATWTKAGGTLNFVGETGGTAPNNDTGDTLVVSSVDASGAISFTFNRTVGTKSYRIGAMAVVSHYIA